MYHINLKSRRGTDGPMGFILAFPIWWTAIGIVLVVGLWWWSMAANVIGLNRSGQAQALAADGEIQRRAYLTAALGGFAADYADADQQRRGRALITSIDANVAIKPFPAPHSFIVQARIIGRDERFYPRPAEVGWE